ncbi:MAG: M23 family metallopeptidase [Proteobacteria bacterium]|nr:M23 family metallopeptidase [Pseudomonadota bacterium]
MTVNQLALSILLASTALLTGAATPGEASSAPSQGRYRLPFADGTAVKVFDDFQTHRPAGREDLYAVNGKEPYRVVAAAAGRIMAIQDSYGEQQSGRSAALCHNNYVWIAHANGEWTNYSHIARGSVTDKARLKVGDRVKAGQYIGDEDAIGCAMLKHVHFEVAVPENRMPIDPGGFLQDNEGGKRERNPRFCSVPGELAKKGEEYVATGCARSEGARSDHLLQRWHE